MLKGHQGGNSSPLSLGKAPSSKNSSNNGTPTEMMIYEYAKQAGDSKISSEDYAYNKIFVGGLHYDTRDGKHNLSVWFKLKFSV